MNRKETIKQWARGFGLALILGAAWRTAPAQGIIHVVPQTPIYYGGPLQSSQDLDLNGDGVTDFVLESDGDTALLAPQGLNRLIAIPEPPPDLGSFVAALSPGFSVGSSLDPVYQWYDRQTDQFGNAVIGSQALFGNQFVVLGYFTGQTAFAGCDLYYDGASHYGWIQIANPLHIVAGAITDWAYETAPDTAILAGQVPEPAAIVLFGLTVPMLCWLFRKRRRES